MPTSHRCMQHLGKTMLQRRSLKQCCSLQSRSLEAECKCAMDELRQLHHADRCAHAHKYVFEASALAVARYQCEDKVIKFCLEDLLRCCLAIHALRV